MSEVSSTSSSYMGLKEATTSPTKTTEDTTGFSAGDFLSLLMTQLTNQNPLEPLSDNEMITQMSIMNAVQELQDMGEAIEQLEQTNQISISSNMIGKTVTYLDSNGKDQDIVVEEVIIDDGKIYLTSGSVAITIDDVVSIKNTVEVEKETEPETETEAV